jgi:hypothetical protein
MKTLYALPFVLLSACGAPGATAQQLTTAPVFAPRTLTVSGLGEASGRPDMAILSIGVETRAPTAAEALKQNAAKMRATLDRLKKRGVAEKDMQTQNLSVNAVYDYETRPGSPRIVGYQAANMLAVKLRDLDKAGAIVDEAVGDGANSLGGFSLTFADPDPVMNRARADAIADARGKAELYAKAAGVSLGPILQITDSIFFTPPPVPYMERAMAADAKATPVVPGETTLSANVTLVYEIR